MKFRTELKPEPSALRLTPGRPAVFVGSCFAENMAARMRQCMWEADRSTGVLYNPASILASLRVTALGSDEDAFRTFRSTLLPPGPQTSHKWMSWLFDSKLAADTDAELCHRFMELRKRLRDTLREAQVLFVTFGTAWCYALTDGCSGLPEGIVANCHKQPAAIFSRRRLTVEEITDAWVPFLSELRGEYPELAIVFTVSPVRHLKDTLHGNNLSKATLQLAEDAICGRVPDCHYFPAYELLTDDLRDYRFYASDLVHPSDQAVEYIWEHFKDTFLDCEALAAVAEGERRYKALNHRPLV